MWMPLFSLPINRKNGNKLVSKILEVNALSVRMSSPSCSSYILIGLYWVPKN